MLTPVGCAQFNSNFIYYIGFIFLLIIGYLWGQRNGSAGAKKKDSKKKDSKK